MKILNKWLRLAAMTAVTMTLLAGSISLNVRAEEQLESQEQTEEQAQESVPPRFLQAFVTDSEIVKAYIRNGALGEGTSYQIGNVPCENINGFSVAEDNYPMRTLILVDNSRSIPENIRGTISESIKQIIAAHVENERIRIGTFSESINYLNDDYSNDYTGLTNEVEAIVYQDQETYLTDVLYDLIKELESEPYNGYTRLIIFSDGVDNKPEGITRAELNELMESRNYPIYTFGAATKSNSEELSQMYALSRITGVEYRTLEAGDEDVIASIVAADNMISVVTSEIPDKLKQGDEKNSRLVFADGSSVEFKVKLPFGIEEEEKGYDGPPIDNGGEGSSDTLVDIADNGDDGILVPTEKDYTKMIFGASLGVLVLVFIIAFLIYNIAFKNKKKKEAPVMPTENLQATTSETELFGYGTGNQNNGTEQLTPSVSDGRKKYMLLLTDRADEDRSFRCELVDEVTIGRMEDNHIIIGDDNSVHRHHSIISVKNGTFYYTDLKDVKNRSSINGVLLKPTIPQLIVNNTVVTIGRHTYTITISEGR